MFRFLFPNDIAMDLGTANTLLYLRGNGIVVNEPSVIAIDKQTSQHKIYVGDRAKEMLGRAPSGIDVKMPLKDGVIADFRAAEDMIRSFILRVTSKRSLIKPRIIVCVPYGSTSVEKRAIQDAAESIAREVFLIEEPIAAAIGAGLPIMEAIGSMIIDIGGGTTEIAVISLSGVVFAISVPCAGNAFDSAIISYIKNKYKLLIGEVTAEAVKKTIGCVKIDENDEIKIYKVRGRDTGSGLPREISISSIDIAESLQGCVERIIQGIEEVLENTKPELLSDIISHGIMLSGGGALLPGLGNFITARTGLNVSIAENPLYCVVNGGGAVLQDFEKLSHVLFKQD